MPRPSAQGKLMSAAMSSFQALGFKGCTIEEIADRAGVFKGSFYNHFKSKEALGVAAVEFYISEGFKTLVQEGPPSATARLRAHFEKLAAAQKANGGHGCLLANFSAEVSDQTPMLREALVKGVNGWYQAVATVIGQGQATGEIPRHYDPERLARFVINAWEGATVRMKVTQSAQPVEDFFALTFDEIFAGRPR